MASRRKESYSHLQSCRGHGCALLTRQTRPLATPHRNSPKVAHIIAPRRNCLKRAAHKENHVIRKHALVLAKRIVAAQALAHHLADNAQAFPISAAAAASLAGALVATSSAAGPAMRHRRGAGREGHRSATLAGAGAPWRPCDPRDVLAAASADRVSFECQGIVHDNIVRGLAIRTQTQGPSIPECFGPELRNTRNAPKTPEMQSNTRRPSSPLH